MSVLIPGMEMPTRCYACPCADLEYYDCNLSPGTRIEKHKRLDNCPLVPVPPHGDLIDRDALFKSDRMVAKLMMFGGEYVYTQTEIDNAPTVIHADPAEEEKHEKER